MTTNDEITNEYEFSGGWVDYMSKVHFIKSLNEARADTSNQIFEELGLDSKLEAIIHISSKEIRYKMFNRYREELIKKFKVD